MKLIITIIFLLFLSNGIIGTPLIDDDADTLSIDVTTILSVPDGEETTVPSSTPIQPAAKLKEGSSNLVCTTTRGKPGNCTTVSECFTILVPATADSSVRNPVLAEMLVESSGFCDENGGNANKILQARGDINPTLLSQILRDEVLLCCPEEKNEPADSFTLDKPDPESNVYDEMFMGRSCGHVDEKDMIEMTEPPTTTTTSDPNSNSTQGRIVKGRKTKVGEFPWVVALMNRNRQFCGGSLINQNTVLTAAHCVQHMSPSDVKNMRLQIGDWDIYKKSDVKHEVRSAKAVKYHKGFSMKHLQHDIALIVLERPVVYSPTIQPICLHSGTPDPEESGQNRGDVAGWGALRELGGQPSDLRAVTVRLLQHEECIKRYSKTRNRIGPAMVCAGSDKGEDSCQGDSGGPLSIDSKQQAKQVGIVSWGIGCGRYPGVYTRVDKYLSWINTNMVKDL